MMKVLGLVVNMVAGLIAIGGGIYLLSRQSESGETWLQVIAYGSGAFFIGCGLYMIGSSIAAASTARE